MAATSGRRPRSSTRREPTEEQWRDLIFAWKVCRHVRSNAIVLAKDRATVGIGAGQMSRVDSVRLAVEKARDAREDDADEVLERLRRSPRDAFFPFADGPQAAIEAGATRGRSSRAAPSATARWSRRATRPAWRWCSPAAATSGTRQGLQRSSVAQPPEVEVTVLRVFCDERRRVRQPARRRARRAFGGRRRPPGAGPAPRLLGDRLRRRCARAGRIQIYTPEVELPFAGHPSVGTAWLLRREGFEIDALRPPAGEVPVRYDGALTTSRPGPNGARRSS